MHGPGSGQVVDGVGFAFQHSLDFGPQFPSGEPHNFAPTGQGVHRWLQVGSLVHQWGRQSGRVSGVGFRISTFLVQGS